MGIFTLDKLTQDILPLFMVSKHAISLMLVLILNITVRVLSRSCTQRKDKFATKIAYVQDKVLPQPQKGISVTPVTMSTVLHMITMVALFSGRGLTVHIGLCVKLGSYQDFRKEFNSPTFCSEYSIAV